MAIIGKKNISVKSGCLTYFKTKKNLIQLKSMIMNG